MGLVWAQQTYYDDSRRDSHMVLPDNATNKWKDHCWHHLANRAAQKMTNKVTNTSSPPQTKKDGSVGVVLFELLLLCILKCCVVCAACGVDHNVN